MYNHNNNIIVIVIIDLRNVHVNVDTGNVVQKVDLKQRQSLTDEHCSCGH